ncbi:MAG: nucleotidyltransferase domain-containing protein [Chloroflexota bacterium]|nr:MAG: nucleotidyltransferase domain-containing protein [Chloroflexota bacterium]
MEAETDVIQELVRRIVEVAHPVRIILFGSAARGQMGPDSDIDVLVVVPHADDRDTAARRIYRNLIGFGTPVDVVVATESDLRVYGDNFSLVYYPALHEGREIYAA